MINKFWRWARNEANERTLYLDGVIAQETWWGDEVTPKLFKDELGAGAGDITVWINSIGGDVFSAAQIYNLLMDYPGQVTVKIDGIAASAASVVAMAGGDVYMSPVSTLMIHNPYAAAIGDSEEMLRAKSMLDEIKESLINAYQLKTNLPRGKLAKMMDDETWMNARKAVELGFADKIMFMDEEDTAPRAAGQDFVFSRMAAANALCAKLTRNDQAPAGTPAASLEKRLSLLPH